MKALVIGSGGREHALVQALKKSPRIREVIAAPGNAGLEKISKCFPIKINNIKELVKLALEQRADLTVVGPEQPLTEGLVDAFRQAGLKIFGPDQRAAILEASKAFTKDFLKKYSIPTAHYAVFKDLEPARRFVEQNAQTRWVVKVDGLAAGKGVFVTQDTQEALKALDQVFTDQLFGRQSVVVEEFLHGEEVSFMVLCDGRRALPLASAQDHKRLLDHDEGPNTGGMGAYSPAPLMTEDLSRKVMATIIEPTLQGMQKEGRPFTGILYAGLMIRDGQPYVLEYNVRFGDPEAQVILPRLESDWVDLFEAALEQRLETASPVWTKKNAVCVVLAAEGYPASPKQGDAIHGLEQVPEGAMVYHAGTARSGDRIVTAGGRVLSVTALGGDLAEAVKNCYAAVSKIEFRGMQYRKDIAARGLKRGA
jgi:phosphoribosylamine--glycine ligase